MAQTVTTFSDNAGVGVPTGWTRTLQNSGTPALITSSTSHVNLNAQSALAGGSDLIAWTGLGSATQSTIAARFRWVDSGSALTGTYATVHIRAPGTTSQSAHGYYISARWGNPLFSGTPRIQLHSRFNPANNESELPALGDANEVADVIASMDTDYWLRLEFQETTKPPELPAGVRHILRGRFWSGAYESEPSTWDVEAYADEGTAFFVDGAGFVSLGVGVPFNSVTFSEVRVGEAVMLASPTDRYRVNLSADSRSLLASAQAVPFDASASVSLPPAVGLLPQQTLYPIRELTRDATAAVYDASFYPRATQNDRQERTYDGVTLLSRMQTAYPARFVGDVDDAGIVNGRANNWVTFFLARWATEFPWFDYETVPQLRMPVPGENGVAKPSEYDEEFSLLNPFPVRQGVVVSKAFSFPQEPGSQLSMYDMLERLLSPFPGAVFFQNASGKLQIVPAYGPDADETPYKAFGSDDVVSVSLGEPSIGTIVNRATVSSRGFVRSEAVAVMQPAWFQVGGNDQLGRTNWYTPPVDRENMQATEDGSILQEGLEPGQFAAQLGVLWPIAADSLPAGDGIGLGTIADPLITVGWARYSNDSLDDSGATGFTLVSELIPFTASGWTTVGTFSASAVNFTLLGRWRDEQQAIELTLASGAKFEQDCFIAPCSTLIAEITLNDSSVGYTETSGVSVTFGTTETSEETPIPNADGTDAVTSSQATYGVLETRVDVDGYVLDAEQALAMAQGIVLANLSPRAIRSLDLGWRGSTVALFDDRGRLFGIPDSGEGLLVGVEYQDDFISVTGGKRVRIEETVPSLPGFIPSDTEWLLNDDSSFWTSEDGSLSEPA